jgi:hypothetical protein
VEKRLDNIADVYSNTVTLLKRLTTYNLYDLQSTEATLESFHRKLTALKVNITASISIRKEKDALVFFIDGNLTK